MSINSQYYEIEAQNSNVRSSNRRVLRIWEKKKYLKKIFLEQGAFSDKQFCENCRACNFFAIWLRIIFSFLNDVDIQLILEYKISFGKYHPVCPKNP